MSKQNLALQLIRGQWAIHPEYAQRWYPSVLNWIQTGQFKAIDPNSGSKNPNFNTGEPQSGIIRFVDEDGNELEPRRDGVTEIPKNSVALIENIGELIKYGNYYCWGADEIAAALKGALASENIIGAVLINDGPGGAVNAIAPLTQVIEASQKPVVALCDMAASAHYYVASSCTHIMAENNISSSFGSIGVMVGFADFTKYYEEMGVKIHEIYATQSTRKNKPYRDALQEDYKSMQSEVLDPLAQKFIDHVKAMRGKKLDTSVEGILAGKMFFADQALQNGLIDSIGTLDLAIQKVHELSSIHQFISNT